MGWGVRRIPIIVEMFRNTEVEKLLRSTWPHVSEKVAIKKKLTAKNDTQQRNLGTVAYNIECKWEKPGQESRSEVGRRARITLYAVVKGYDHHG